MNHAEKRRGKQANTAAAATSTTAALLATTAATLTAYHPHLLHLHPHYNHRPIHKAQQQDVASHRDLTYYAKCATGGACASIVRWVLTPLEVLKGYNQVGLLLVQQPNEKKSASGASTTRSMGIARGMRSLWLQEGWSGLFKGLGPTSVAYAIQTGTKYSLYEFFKDRLLLHNNNTINTSSMSSTSSWVYIVAAAAGAEICASVLMCPWEQVRVKVQTSAPGTFPTSFQSALTVMIQRRAELRFPFGGLVPLWARQVPGTIANLYTFETTVRFIYRHLLNEKPRESYSVATQLSVTLLSGYIAGFASAVVSHPPDSLLSLMNQPQHKHRSLSEIVRTVGWRQLATRGLAPRVLTTGTVIAGQWWIYDTFKTIMGMGTTGGS